MRNGLSRFSDRALKRMISKYVHVQRNILPGTYVTTTLLNVKICYTLTSTLFIPLNGYLYRNGIFLLIII